LGGRSLRGGPHEMKALLLVFFLCLASVALGGCEAKGDTAHEATTLGPQTVGDLTATLSVNPYPPSAMGQAEFLFKLVDGQGWPVTGAKVGCDMTMPAMPMPPNHPTGVESSPGVYRMEVMFTMAGDWEAAVQALLSDGSVTEFVFAMNAS
jgi:hypothetical protein